ncbi:hypothetical protein V8C86DRAFT_683944 [Haematococcus lacustris]
MLPLSVVDQNDAASIAVRVALLDTFRKLDVDGSGFIELHEMRALATQLTPKANLDDALNLLRFADRDKDSRVSKQEYLTVMESLMQSLTPLQAQRHLAALGSDAPYQALNDITYQHPTGCRAYLGHEVLPVLRQGLLGLVDAVQAASLSLAAGSEWEEGPELQGAPGVPEDCRAGGQPGVKYLPRHWKPFSPLRWLGSWLLEQCPSDGTDLDSASHGAADQAPRAWQELSRVEKVERAFQHLDTNKSGTLEVNELLVLAGKLRKEQDLAQAQGLLETMDLDRNGVVDLDEYSKFVLQLTEVLTDSEFDASIHKVLGARHLSLCTSRQDKFRFLFHELDPERTGRVSMDELVSVAQRIDPEATLWKIKASLEFLGSSDTHTVDVGQFVAGLDKLTQGVEGEDKVDALITHMLEGRRVGLTGVGGAPGAEPMDEVEPLALQELCRALPSLPHSLQVGCTELMDDLSGHGSPKLLLLVDVRGAEEVAVSSIQGSVHVPAVPDSSAALGWRLGSLDPIHAWLRAKQESQPGQVPRVVAYCNTGLRSSAVAAWLSKQLRLPVRSLTGGSINYYNQGGRVRDAEGREVQAMHPGSPELRAYVTRPNNFKLQA